MTRNRADSDNFDSSSGWLCDCSSSGAMRLLLAMTTLAAAVAASVAFVPDAEAGNYILYFHGRSQNGWAGGELVNPPPGWTNVTFSYDGNQRINSDATNVAVRNGIATYCTNGNVCIINAYSAGVYRTLKAMHDLGNHAGIPGLAYVNAGASAAGGSPLAEVATRGITGFIAKIFGQQTPLDFDLTPGAARNTYGYIQDAAYDAGGSYLFHTAGSKDLCVKLLFVKLCSGRTLIGGANDGVVGFASSAGYMNAGTYTDACNGGAKYPGRAYETANAGCGGENRDHFGMSGRASSVLAAGMQGHVGLIASATDYARAWSDGTTEPDCNDSNGECDQPFYDPNKNFCRANDGTQVCSLSGTASGSNGDTTSTTSCQSSCGKFTGSCWCDSSCSAHGDCCSDYAAANCGAVNDGQTSSRARFYRSYSGSGGHFYTSSKSEAINAGFNIEGTHYIAQNNDPGTAPFYRCYLSNVNRHFLTTSPTCENASYSTNEGAVGYIYTSQVAGTVPLYRRYSGSGNDHLYSLDYNEGSNVGYAYEGIAGYVFTSSN